MESGLKILNRYSFSSTAAKLKINKILAAVSHRSLSRKQLSEIAHLSDVHIKNYINYLIATNKIYISTWKLEQQGKQIRFWPYYHAGCKKSKPKPEKLSSSERSKRYREKLKKDVDRLEKRNFKRRAKRLTIKQDWTSTWIKASNSTQTSDAGA